MSVLENPMVYVRNTGDSIGGGMGEVMAPPPPPSMMPFQPAGMGGMQFTPMWLQMTTFDGKRMRWPVHRKTVDYNSTIFNHIQNRLYRKSLHFSKALQPHTSYYPDMLPPMGILDNPVNAVTTRFVRMSTNKFKCPIHVVRWTRQGRRLFTGTGFGEITLWNGLTFNFETIQQFLKDGKRCVSGASSGEFAIWSGNNFDFQTNIQAHDTAIRVMEWNRSETWLLTADHSGNIKYWQSNMNNVKTFDAHTEVIRDASFSPTDKKFVTCSDDSTVKVWDFYNCFLERSMRGHGAEVKCCDWHPQKGLIVSGSKDTQQPIKLWDPRVGHALSTLHLHKATVTRTKWNRNGNWLLTSSRDHLLKIYDIRAMKELQVCRGHKKEVMSIAWHPIHESLFASGGGDGSVLFWVVGTDREVGGMDTAHEAMVLSLDWHPLGHVLASGSNDHTAKFWTRNRPGDKMNTNPSENIEYEVDDPLGLREQQTVTIDEKIIPGMGEINHHDIDDSVINTLAPSKVISKSNEKTSSRSLMQLIPTIKSEVVPGLQISTDQIKGELEAAALDIFFHQPPAATPQDTYQQPTNENSSEFETPYQNPNFAQSDDYGYDEVDYSTWERPQHTQYPMPEDGGGGSYNKNYSGRGGYRGGGGRGYNRRGSGEGGNRSRGNSRGRGGGRGGYQSGGRGGSSFWRNVGRARGTSERGSRGNYRSRGNDRGRPY